MSLIDYSYRMSRKSDVQEKIMYSLIIQTNGGSGAPNIDGDPTARITVGSIANGVIYYLMVKGDYQNFITLPIPSTQLTYSPIIHMRGTVISNGVSLAADAANVVFVQGNPDAVSVPNNYTLFPFMCVNPLNGHSVAPTVGVSINIDIVKFPQFQYNVV